MKRFSLRRMGEATERAVRRFPLVLVCAVAAAVFGCILVDEVDEHPWAELLMTAQLGIPLFMALGLAAGRRDGQGLPRWAWPALHLLGLAILALFYAARNEQLGDADWILFMQLNVGFHLLVTVLPFARGGETRGMWQFSVTLLLRFITAAFFSLVLFAGLSLALAALDMLFGVDLDDEIYLQLWIVIVFVFNTAYVLGGVPERLADLDRAEDYPRVLKVFARFILAPLVVVYLAILTAYLVKVVATGEWPSGWIGWLVSSVAAAGILSLLLLKPESERDDRRWVRLYARLYYWLMVPAVVMLALAIFKRIDQYGVTEMRYFMLVLTAWLAVVVAAGCWRRQLLVKAIPASLAALAFITALGPWGAGAVSHRSQLGRLETLLAAHERLVDGLLAPADTEVPAEDGNEVKQILRYLFDLHGPGALDELVDAELQVALDAARAEHEFRSLAASSQVDATLEYMGLEVLPLSLPARPGSYSFHRELRNSVVAVDGHQYVVDIQRFAGPELTMELDGEPCRVDVDWKTETLVFTCGEKPLVTASLADLIARLRPLKARGPAMGLADSLLVVPFASASAHGELRFNTFFWDEDDDGGITGGGLTGHLLLSLESDGE